MNLAFLPTIGTECVFKDPDFMRTCLEHVQVGLLYDESVKIPDEVVTMLNTSNLLAISLVLYEVVEFAVQIRAESVGFPPSVIEFCINCLQSYPRAKVGQYYIDTLKEVSL